MSIFIIVLCIIGIIIWPLYIKFNLVIHSTSQQLSIDITPVKNLKTYRRNIPLKPKNYGLFYIQIFREYMNRIKAIESSHSDIIYYVKSKLKIENLSIEIDLGLDDAAEAALYCGMVITIIDFIYYNFLSQFVIKMYNRKVHPVFNRNIIDVDINCIMRVRTGYIIIVASKVLGSKIAKAVKHICQINIQ